MGMPESILGFRLSYYHFHWTGAFVGAHNLQSNVKIVFFDALWPLFYLVECESCGDGALFVDIRAVTGLNSSSIISLSNITSISVRSCGPSGTCDIPYKMLSSTFCGILSVISFPLLLH